MRHCGTYPPFWLQLQRRYELEVEQERPGGRQRSAVRMFARASERR